MPAADPNSRGTPRKFRKPTDVDRDGLIREVRMKDCINPDELFELVEQMIEMGHGVTVGIVRNRTALSFVFHVDGEKVKRYPHSRESWLDVLAELED